MKPRTIVRSSVSIKSNQLSYGFASATSPLASWYHSSWRNLYAPSNSNQFRHGTLSVARMRRGVSVWYET
jgi:hypothetical protein